MCLLVGAGLMLVCGTLSACGTKPEPGRRRRRESVEWSSAEPSGRSFDGRALLSRDQLLFVEERGAGGQLLSCSGRAAPRQSHLV